jgi:AcrR family transcriptional regulator
MGLREHKKHERRRGLIENAVALFRESGFEATRVQDIAARCGVSEATFFNYFGCKEAVLGEWAHGLVARALCADSASGIDTGREGVLRRSLRERVRDLAAGVEADRVFAARAFLRAPLLAPAAAESGGGGAARALIASGQTRGEIRGDLPAEQLAGLLHGVLAQGIAAWLADASLQADPLALRLQRAVDLLLDGFRKRNERVRAPLAAGPRPAPSPG